MSLHVDDHCYNENFKVRVERTTVSEDPDWCMIMTKRPGHDGLTVWLNHDQAWALRDRLNELLADGCPTTIDTDGLNADVYAAIVAVDRVAERVGLKKEETVNA